MTSLESALAAYYEQDAPVRAGRSLDPARVAWRDDVAGRLLAEGRTRVLEVGVGPGHDALALAAAGATVTGVDLAVAHVRICRRAGIEAYVASVLALPFSDGSYDAGWTMSTLLHVPDSHLDAALAEIARVLRPGAPLAVGVWGGRDWQGTTGDGPAGTGGRFFSLRSDDRLREVLGRVGTVERFDTWPHGSGAPDAWSYQAAVVRLH